MIENQQNKIPYTLTYTTDLVVRYIYSSTIIGKSNPKEVRNKVTVIVKEAGTPSSINMEGGVLRKF